MENLRKDIKNTLYALLIAGMVGGVSACGNNERTNTDTSSSTNTGRAYEGGSDAETMEMDENSWMKDRDTYVSDNRAKLDKIDRDIEAREREMGTLTGKTKSASLVLLLMHKVAMQTLPIMWPCL